MNWETITEDIPNVKAQMVRILNESDLAERDVH